MNFEEFKKAKLKDIMKAKNHLEFIAILEATKVEMVLNFVDVDGLLKGR